MTNKEKASAQLPIGSYEWVKARVREHPNDAYAQMLILRYELSNGGVDIPPVVI